MQNQKFYPKSQIDSKPNLEKMFQIGSISKTEKAFLDALEIRLGLKIERQVKFGNYILIDGVAGDWKIAIEYDGPKNHQSPEKQEKDQKRDRILMAKGYSIYRLQWFDFEKDFGKYQSILQNEVNEASRAIKMLINLQNLKNLQNAKKHFKNASIIRR